jgi:hypothetical protein
MGSDHITQKPPEGPSIVDAAPDMRSPRRKIVTKYVFDIPASAQTKDTDPTQITLVELSADDERMARKIGGADPAKQAEELVKLSLYAVNGKAVNQAEAEADFYWERFGAKMRHLMLLAFTRTHATTDQEEESFFGSMRTEVGGR